MSLFKTRTFWKTDCENCENFDQNSLIVAKLNSIYDLVIIGSQTGFLRIFQPELTETEYKPTHLIIEKQLSDPILQIKSGKLVSGTSQTQLAVLHDKYLSVYSLLTKDGETSHGMQNSLQLNYEHRLKHLGANFTVGPFGGSQNRDFICVQSLDGLLIFYEQESFAFSCFLPDFLLPGPFAFANKSDGFIFGCSDWSITSYKYKLLSESDKITKNDWKYNLGECCIDIQVIDAPQSKENFIMVLGERNFFCLNNAGKLKYMKKLEFAPFCFTNYILDDERVISMIVSETRTLLIYQVTSLKWCAQLDILPICIQRAFLSTIGGAIVLLSDSGQLECSYLGTEPCLFTAPPMAEQQVDFDKIGLELTSLQKTIKSAYNNDTKMTNASAERELTLTVQVGVEPALAIAISPHGGVFEELQVAIYVKKPLEVEPKVRFFTALSAPIDFKCAIFRNGSGNIASLNVDVIATFISNAGLPRCIVKNAMLPLALVVEACSPQKEGDFKLTLGVNHAPVGLNVLFPEFVGETANALGLRAIGDNVVNVVSILLAKSSERYRIQSDSLPALALTIEQMVYRLRKYHTNSDNFAVSLNSSLPIAECVRYIGQHFDARHKYNVLQGELSQLSAQFRLVQKRLISKFKVKNPTPLANLELLLNDTFQAIVKTAHQFEEAGKVLVAAQNELLCAMHAITYLIRLMDCTNDAIELIESTLIANEGDLDTQGWEDVADASLCYLLRTVLAKSDKDRFRAAHTSFDDVKDVAKVEKHFIQVLERIPKGIILENEKSLSENKSDADEDVAVKIGSEIGEASLRLLSARAKPAPVL